MNSISLWTRILRISIALVMLAFQPIQFLRIEAQAQAVKKIGMVFGHGAYGSPGARFPSTLQQNLGIDTGLYNQQEYNASSGLVSQARSLKSNVQSVATAGATDIILVGTGLGGLRNRAYVQSLRQTNERSQSDNVRAMVSIGSPHTGAPAMTGLPILSGLALGIHAAGAVAAGFAGGGAYALTTSLLAGPGLFAPVAGFSVIQGNIARGQAATDLSVNSAFLNTINATSTCRWESTQVQRWGWFGHSWWETVNYQICVPGNSLPIDNDIFTLSVYSNNTSLNELNSSIVQYQPPYYPPATVDNPNPELIPGQIPTPYGFTDQQRELLTALYTAFSVGFLIAAFYTFGATIWIAVAFAAVALFYATLPSLYATAIGGSEHDGAFPVSSQKMRSFDVNNVCCGVVSGTGWQLGGNEIDANGYYIRAGNFTQQNDPGSEAAILVAKNATLR